MSDECDRVRDNGVERGSNLLEDRRDLQADRPRNHHHAVKDEFQNLLADGNQEVQQSYDGWTKDRRHFFEQHFRREQVCNLERIPSRLEQRLDPFPREIELLHFALEPRCCLLDRFRLVEILLDLVPAIDQIKYRKYHALERWLDLFARHRIPAQHHRKQRISLLLFGPLAELVEHQILHDRKDLASDFLDERPHAIDHRHEQRLELLVPRAYRIEQIEGANRLPPLAHQRHHRRVAEIELCHLRIPPLGDRIDLAFLIQPLEQRDTVGRQLHRRAYPVARRALHRLLLNRIVADDQRDQIPGGEISHDPFTHLRANRGLRIVEQTLHSSWRHAPRHMRSSRRRTRNRARCPRGTRLLLNRVRQFVRDETLSLRTGRLILAGTKKDVVANRERTRAQCARRTARLMPGVRAHTAEVVPKAWLKLTSNRRRQR